MRKFWTHSLSTALLCKKLAQFYPHLFPMTPEEQDSTYLAGLLHDIGYVVMASLLPGEFTTMTRLWEAGAGLVNSESVGCGLSVFFGMDSTCRNSILKILQSNTIVNILFFL